jgi:hypothetical protein
LSFTDHSHTGRSCTPVHLSGVVEQHLQLIHAGTMRHAHAQRHGGHRCGSSTGGSSGRLQLCVLLVLLHGHQQRQLVGSGCCLQRIGHGVGGAVQGEQ